MNTHDDNGFFLRKQLRHEARQSRPAFSESLHARILAAISAAESHGPTVPGAGSQRFMRNRRLTWLLTTTAAIAMTLALGLLLSGPRPSQRDAIALDTPGARSPGSNVNSEFALPQDVAVSPATDKTQWAGLDRDAQTALAAVAGPLPFDLTFSLVAQEK
jgi:hypothetical protein